MIRVNPNVLPDLISSIEHSQTNQQNAVQQLATGRRINNLSDDPASAAALVTNNAQSSNVDQFLSNASDAQGKLQTADSAMSSAVEILTTAITVGTEGANGTLSASDRQALAQQVQGMQQQMLGLANTSYQGVYIFGGTNVTAQPFTTSASSPSGVQYQGNASVTSVQVGEGQSVQTNVPGAQLFLNSSGNVFKALNDLSSALNSGTGIEAANTEVQQAFSQLSTQRVTYGNALTQLQSSQTFLSQEQVNLSTQQNKLVGADLTSVIANESQAQVDLQAALSATGQFLSLPNLFSFLK
jgi:flagellar hook-associated protein 3 FlgL